MSVTALVASNMCFEELIDMIECICFVKTSQITLPVSLNGSSQIQIRLLRCLFHRIHMHNILLLFDVSYVMVRMADRVVSPCRGFKLVI